jgi:hypothetical protein
VTPGGSLGFYRALDTTLAQKEERTKRPLPMPVLAIGGARSYGADVGKAMEPLADDVQSVVIPGAGHWVAEEAPDEMLGSADCLPGPIPRRTGRGTRLEGAGCRASLTEPRSASAPSGRPGSRPGSSTGATG